MAHWFKEERQGLDLAEWRNTESVSKWRDSEPGGNDKTAEISKNGGFFHSISKLSRNAYICETPGGKITFQP